MRACTAITLRVGLFAAVLLSFSCGPRAPRFEELASPAGPASNGPYLASGNGRVYLSWLEKRADGEHALRFAEWDGRAWSPPRTITAGGELLMNWADFPSILPMEDGALVAQWLEKNAGEPQAYDVAISRSENGGSTWSAPLRPHRDGTPTEHGFVSLVDMGAGKVGVIWLDGRKLHDVTPEMALMFAVFENGACGPEMLLDPRVCDCCQTAAVATPDGLFVAYRDRSPDEVRDISYVRGEGGLWSAPAELDPDGWEIPGCPVNGPAVSGDGRRLAVAWFTAAGGEAMVQVAFSNSAGRVFDPAVRVDVDEGIATGRVDVEWLPDGAALVSWIERREGEGSEIRARRVTRDGSLGPSFLVSATSGGRSSGFPRMTRSGADVFIAWTDPADPPRVRVARLTP